MKHKLRPLKHDIRRVDPFSRRPGKQNAIARRPEWARERESVRETRTRSDGVPNSPSTPRLVSPSVYTHSPDGRFTRHNHARRTRVTRVLVVVVGGDDDTEDTAEKAFNYRVGPQSFLYAGVSGREMCWRGGDAVRLDYNITIARTPTPQPTATVCRSEVRCFFFCVNRKSPDQSRVVSEEFEKNAVKPVRTVKRAHIV